MTSALKPLRVSREYVRKAVEDIDRHAIMAKRFGRQVADAKLKARGAGVETLRPLERVELDHFLCDVHLVCPKTGAGLGRPWLTLAVDHFSGLLIGYYLTFAPPSAESVLACLRHAILPKKPVTYKEGALDDPSPITISWVGFGIPDLLAVDNGTDLTSFGVRDSCLALAIDLLYTPPRAPWYKGVVERIGRTMNVQLVHWLPGTTLGTPTGSFAYDGKKEAVYTLETFRILLEYFFTNIYNKSAGKGETKSREHRFLKGIEWWPVRLPESMEAFDTAVALHVERELSNSGITFEGAVYQSEETKKWWYQVSQRKHRLAIKVNPCYQQAGFGLIAAA